MTVTGSRIATKRRSLNDDVGTSVVGSGEEDDLTKIFALKNRPDFRKAS